MKMVKNISIPSVYHRLFDIGVIIKGIDGCIETIGGVLLMMTNQQILTRIVVLLTQHELNQDPRDFIANSILQAAMHLSVQTKLLASLYLLIHGIIKILLATSLLKGKLQAYPIAISILSLFAIFQCIRFVQTQTLFLLGLTCFDSAIIVLVILEYKAKQKKQKQMTMKNAK